MIILRAALVFEPRDEAGRTARLFLRFASVKQLKRKRDNSVILYLVDGKVANKTRI